eukprot:CAMPEP_0176034498 /NCGR_PEP_ID=MMETSP0120_2-20121206/17054_1 /TAXON_ID=160619 /ORGANISM="Kryptoperidinium foliaceum, Strain CCMP 1326" /LENGTH=355 /DNA_ID=CAMNT_0017367841 /DNA_START=29 /DNA_END=1093 /DNA_ORIENTATION=+
MAEVDAPAPLPASLASPEDADGDGPRAPQAANDAESLSHGLAAQVEDNETGGLSPIALQEAEDVERFAPVDPEAVSKDLASPAKVCPSSAPEALVCSPPLPLALAAGQLLRTVLRSPAAQLAVEEVVNSSELLVVAEVGEEAKNQLQVGDYVMTVDGKFGTEAMRALLVADNEVEVLAVRPKTFEVVVPKHGKTLGLSLNYKEGGPCLFVTSVHAGEAVSECGADIQDGDRIVSVNGVTAVEAMVSELCTSDRPLVNIAALREASSDSIEVARADCAVVPRIAPLRRCEAWSALGIGVAESDGGAPPASREVFWDSKKERWGRALSRRERPTMGERIAAARESQSARCRDGCTWL